jgi:hypothetical protein
MVGINGQSYVLKTMPVSKAASFLDRRSKVMSHMPQRHITKFWPMAANFHVNYLLVIAKHTNGSFKADFVQQLT